MTLRSDIHSAVDAFVPPAPWLPSAISESIVASRSGKRLTLMRRQRPWMTGLRGAGILAALLIVVLLVVGVLIGGQLWRDWSGADSRAVPAAVGNQDMLAELQAQRLNHGPALPPSGPTVQVPSGPLAPGTHEYLDVDQQGFNVRFIVPAGWTWNGRYLSKGTAAIYFFGGPVHVYGDPCRWATAPSKPTTGFSASQIVAALAAQPLRSATTPISLPINIPVGWPGVAIELMVPGDLSFATCDQGQFRSWGPEGVVRSHQGPGQRDLVWAADVPGSGLWNPGVGIEPPGGLIIDAAYFPGTPAAVRSEIVTILGSITGGRWG